MFGGAGVYKRMRVVAFMASLHCFARVYSQTHVIQTFASQDLASHDPKLAPEATCFYPKPKLNT